MGAFLRNLYLYVVPARGNAYRPRLLSGPWLLFFLVVVFSTEGIFFVSVHVPKVDLPAAVVQSEIVTLTNSERAEVGAHILAENAHLTGAAQAKANDMAAKGYFSHTSPDGTEPWEWLTAAGYSYRYAGENLAVRFGSSAGVVSAWMASLSHRTNIVKQEYAEIGVGVAEGQYQGAPATFVVQYFGTSVARAAGTTPLDTASGPQVPTVNSVTAAVTTAAPGSLNVTQSTLQQWLRAVAEHPASIALSLGIVAGLLFFMVLVGFFTRIQVQPAGMLVGGLVVGSLALLFIALNVRVFTLPSAGQEAALGALGEPPGIIGEGIATKLWVAE